MTRPFIIYNIDRKREVLVLNMITDKESKEIEYHNRQGEGDRIKITEMVAKSWKPLHPYEIKELLGKTSSYENQLLRDREGEENKKSDETMKEVDSISIESIQYWCRELTKDGILENDAEHGGYSIPDKVAKEIRHFPSAFSTEALCLLLTPNNFSIYTTPTTITEKGVAGLVSRFGALIVYAFIEAIRPFENATTTMSAEAKDKTVLRWIRNVIPLKRCLTNFLQYYSHQIEKKRRTRKKRKMMMIFKVNYYYMSLIEKRLLGYQRH